MQNNEQGNQSPSQNSDARSSSNRDWRDECRDWRMERRELRRRSPFRGLFPGLFLILIGGLFLSTQQGWIRSDSLWQYLVIGLGTIFIIHGLVNYRNPYYRHGAFWRFIPGTALILAGVLSIFELSQWWPLILISAGVAIILCAFSTKQHSTGQ
jgi:hypothetical protein